MSDTPAFSGTIPANYDRYLGPMFFEPYARDLAARVVLTPGQRLLELACGTGIVTQALAPALDAGVSVTATDLNDQMIAIARAKFQHPRLVWQQADATALPFEPASFDGALCQFGAMFFPDKAGAARQVRHVLKPGGRYVCNVWGSLEDNPIAGLAHRVISELFPVDTPGFYKVPWGYHDAHAIRQDLAAGGFDHVTIERVDLEGPTTAADAAIGVVQGSPVSEQIRARGTRSLDQVTARMREVFEETWGAGPFAVPMRAYVVTAQ